MKNINPTGGTSPSSPERGWWLPIAFLRARFLIGIEFLAPFVITYVIFAFVIDFISDTSQPLFQDWFGYKIPGLGYAILFGTPLLFGALALHLFGVRTMLTVEATVARLPLIGPLFAMSHQIVSAFGGDQQTGFGNVVTVEHPRKGVWSLGFLSSVIERNGKDQLALVYLPSPPSPHTGSLVLFPIEEVHRVDIAVNDMMKTMLSAGIVAPEKFQESPLTEASGAVPSEGS